MAMVITIDTATTTTPVASSSIIIIIMFIAPLHVTHTVRDNVAMLRLSLHIPLVSEDPSYRQCFTSTVMNHDIIEILSMVVIRITLVMQKLTEECDHQPSLHRRSCGVGAKVVGDRFLVVLGRLL